MEVDGCKFGRWEYNQGYRFKSILVEVDECKLGKRKYNKGHGVYGG